MMEPELRLVTFFKNPIGQIWRLYLMKVPEPEAKSIVGIAGEHEYLEN